MAGDEYLTPMGQVMSVFGKHYDQRSILVTSAISEGLIDVAASVDIEERSLIVTTVNRSPLEAAELFLRTDTVGQSMLCSKRTVTTWIIFLARSILLWIRHRMVA